MNRLEIYSGQSPRSYDFLYGARYAVEGLGWAMADALGSSVYHAQFGTSPLLSLDATGVLPGITTGLSGSATAGLAALVSGFDIKTPSGFTFNMSAGTVYVVSGADNIGNIQANGGTLTGYGDIAGDATHIVHQALATSFSQLFTPPSGSTILWYLVYATPTQVDVTNSDDPNFSASAGTVPNSAILPYYNSSNPQQPLMGPGGTNPPTSQQSSRQAIANVGISTNGLTSVSATIPAALTVSGNAVPLYVGYLTSSDVGINLAHLWPAGQGTCPTYTGGAPFPAAPFVRGLTEQHHLGVAGSAPKIDGALEWKPLGPVPFNSQNITGVAQLYAVTLTAATNVEIGGGGYLRFDTGGIIYVNGKQSAGNFGFSMPCAQGAVSAVTTLQQLFTFTPISSGMYVVHIYASGGSTTTSPVVSLGYKDSLSGSLVSLSATISMTQLGTSGIWVTTIPINAASGTAIVASIQHGAAETIANAQATLVGL